MFVFLALMAMASPDHEYFTDRADALGAYMRCAASAFERDQSIGSLVALDQIKLDCRPLRDEAVRIFAPLYQRRIGADRTITDVDVAERTVLGVVLAEQMRREEEGAALGAEKRAEEAVNLAIQPYRRCLGTYVAPRLPQDFGPAKTQALAQELQACTSERAGAVLAAEAALATAGVTDPPAIHRRVSKTLCEIDHVWGSRPATPPTRVKKSRAPAVQETVSTAACAS